ncbi:MAG TPA: ATP synthase F0 subunit B [Candidatus Acidoferrales bacterium]|nr:ATP synthase F0 subunit B [Candidatus Acidoferrales bacterium]
MRRAVRFAGRFVGLTLALAGTSLLLAAAPAFAEESKPSLADLPIGWVFRWVNFAIVLGLLVFAFRKARPYFRSHTEEIAQKIAEGTRAREAAEKQRREAQAKLAGIETDVAEMRVDAKRGADAEAERLRILARTEADAIERAAQAEVAAAERAARIELKMLAAGMAVERAEALLRQELTPKAEAALFRTFVGELEGSAN